jgi:hypothetical protein
LFYVVLGFFKESMVLFCRKESWGGNIDLCCLTV